MKADGKGGQVRDAYTTVAAVQQDNASASYAGA